MRRILTGALVLTLSACAMTPEQQAAFRAGLQSLNEPVPAPAMPPPVVLPSQMAIVPPTQLSPMQQPTQQAFWTGRSKSGQSVTGAFGMNCEYNFAGRLFWRMYSGGCPSSVPVQ